MPASANRHTADLTEQPASRLTGMTIRAALLLGLGLTAGIWLFAGYYYNQRVEALEARTADLSARYLKAQDLLTAARNQVIRASVLIRDALLDTNRPPLRDYPRELALAYTTAELTLQQYVPVLDTGSERDRVLNLQREIASLRKEMHAVLSEMRPNPNAAGRVLSDRIMPRREAVIRIAEELQSLNREAFVQHQIDIAEVHHVLQRAIWQFLGVALVASLCIGVFAMVYAGRLERRIRRQSEQDAENRRDLQRLSARLVTAQEEERRAIARELHDEVGQVLTAIKVELAIAARSLGPNNQSLADARVITERAMQTVRDMSQLLHPPLLDDLGLPETLEWYVKDFRKRHGLLVDLAIDQPIGELSREATVAAYRIVQEALHNVVKHARAAHCRVSLTRAPQALKLIIEDDGVGFEVAQLNEAGGARGLGLIGIRERVAQLRGSVQIDSVPGGGTRVEIELPQPGRGEPLAATLTGETTIVAPSAT